MKEKISSFIGNVKKYWREPAAGRFVPFREIAAYGVGGIGVHFATTLASAIGLSASNFLVGSALGIDPVHLQTMGIIASAVGFFLTLLRSYLFDNTKSKDGKFRPWLKWMGVPTVLASILFVWLPYEHMTYMEKVVAVELCYLLINCFSPFFTEAFNMLVQVMSPSTEERTDIMSIGQVIFSLAPTITNLIIPALAPMTGGLNDIRTYRIIYPLFTLVGLGFTYFIYAGTKERILYAKNDEHHIRFFDAVRSAAQNKYFWITNIATWIGFLESAYLTILQWTFVYAMPERQGWLGVANTVIGNGALWSMLIAPFLIRRFGKRNLLIWCNLANIVMLATLYFSYTNIWVVMVICYLNNFINVFGNIYNPGIQADMKDYHQWKTGERIDGMFGAVGLIGTVIGFGTGYVLPTLYRRYGLTTDYDVLYNADVRNGIFRMLIVASVIGAFCNFIPYLFYDLTEEKHYGIMHVLRVRTALADFADGTIDDEALRTGTQIIETAQSLSGEEKQPLPKGRKQRAARKETRTRNKEIAAAAFVREELEKFDTPRYRARVEAANQIVQAGMDGVLQMDVRALTQKIKQTPKTDAQSKAIRSDLRALRRNIKSAQKLTKKHYPNGPQAPDPARLETAQQCPAASLAETVKKKRAVSAALKEQSVYKRCIAPLTQAETTLRQAKSYAALDEFLVRGRESLAQAQNAEAVEAQA